MSKNASVLGAVGLVLFGLLSSAPGQDGYLKVPIVSCSPEISQDLCKEFQFHFSNLAAQGYQVYLIFQDAATFKSTVDSIAQRRIAGLKSGRISNPTLPHPFSERILFVRENDMPCPTKVYISMDAFKPLSFTADDSFSDRVWLISKQAAYVGGILSGCTGAYMLFTADEANRRH